MLRRLRYLAGSLKARLALAGVVLIAASVALTLVLVLHAMERRSQRAVLDAELANAERIAVVLSTKLVSLQTALRQAAGEVPAGRLDDPAALTRYLQGQGVLRSLFDSVFIASPQGRLVAVADSKGIRPISIDASDRNYVRRTLAERRSVVSQPGVSRTDGVSMFVITMPVAGRDGAVRAILVCGTRLSTNPLVDDLTRPSSGGHDPVTTVVTDAGGLVISHPDAGRVLHPLAADPRFERVVAAWKSQGAPIDPQGSSARLGDDIVAFAGVPDADWVVFRSAPAELLLGGPLAGRAQATWIGAAVAVAGGGIILAALVWLLRPLRQLERRALRLLEDDLAPEAGWPRAGGELGQLVRVFRHAMKQQAAMRAEGDALFEKMRAVMTTAPAGIAFTRLGRFELVSEQFGRLFGYDSALVPGMPTNVLCPSTEAHDDFVRVAGETFAGGGQCDVERELVRADSSRFWARMQGAPVRQGDPGAGTIWIFTDITESRRQREQLSWSASHDELTGLVNRREFELRLAEQLAALAPEEPAAALFIDLDRFKAVNDAFGHAAGDVLLKDVAVLIGGRARAQDTVARLGGDEFAVLLRGCTRAAAQRVATEICARVADYRLRWPGAAGEAPAIGASVGVVAIEPGFASVEALMHAADLACYEAKRAGRGTVRVHRRDAPAGHVDAPDDEPTLQD